MSDGIVTSRDQAQDRPEIDDGRYLYCLVDPDQGADLRVEGIDGQSVYLINIGDVAAVVHRCTQIYDDTSIDQLRRRLLTHHNVVDQAGDRFGTPIPLRFHTIIEGDDTAVSEWLRDQQEEITDALSTLDGAWEYRIRLNWDDEALERHVSENSEQLDDLSRRIDQAGAGKKHLLEKECERVRREQVNAYKETVVSDLADDISPDARQVDLADAEETVSLAAGDGDDGSHSQLVVLASCDCESTIGDRLDEFADCETADIQFTGPWAPYSFVPEFGDHNGAK